MCEITQEFGAEAAEAAGDFREFTDQLRKGDPDSAVQADQLANAMGRQAGAEGTDSCANSCSVLAPRGLDEVIFNISPVPMDSLGEPIFIDRDSLLIEE